MPAQPPDVPIQVEKARLLVVEGKDEQRFFCALCTHQGLTEIQVLPIGGKTQLGQKLLALSKSPGFPQLKSLGIVRDADTDPASAFQSVAGALGAAGLPSPAQPMEPAGTQLRVLVMILPGGERPGMLEDLCLAAVKDDKAASCVDGYFQCLQKNGLSLLHEESKARVHVFLASKLRPDLRLGEAAEAGYWPWDHEAFNQLKEFLRRVSW